MGYIKYFKERITYSLAAIYGIILVLGLILLVMGIFQSVGMAIVLGILSLCFSCCACLIPKYPVDIDCCCLINPQGRLFTLNCHRKCLIICTVPIALTFVIAGLVEEKMGVFFIFCALVFLGFMMILLCSIYDKKWDYTTGKPLAWDDLANLEEF